MVLGIVQRAQRQDLVYSPIGWLTRYIPFVRLRLNLQSIYLQGCCKQQVQAKCFGNFCNEKQTERGARGRLLCSCLHMMCVCVCVLTLLIK